MKKQSSAVKKDELIFNKILILFLAAFAAEVIFLVLNRLYLYAGTFMVAHAIVSVLQYVSIGVAVLGIVLFAVLLKKGKARRGVFTFLLGAAWCLACWEMEFFYPHGAKYLCYLIPALLILGLIYYIYPRDLFCSAVMSAGVLLDLLIIRQAWGNLKWMGTLWVLAAVLVAALLVCGLFTRKLAKTGGRGTLLGTVYELLPKKAKYPLLYAMELGGAAVLLAAMVIGAGAAYFLTFLVGAYLFILIVYYTTKLI